jgi:hypothetical protein
VLLSLIAVTDPGAAGATLFNIVSINMADPVPLPFVAFNVTGNVPVTVAVPAITPVAESMVSPAGKPVALKLVGVAEAVIA